MTTPLLHLQHLGQSPWHDNIRRSLLDSGELQKMVADGDITGLTSNPTIFEQAIANSTDYDATLRDLARDGKNAEGIFDALAIEDIRDAADVFRPVYERTGGKDGYVSIEVSPKYAHDTKKTISEAKRLWKAVGHPNVMIKIPATKAGLPAIEETIAAGINVNVTLIFSLERHDEVMTAHLNGLKRRLAAGKKVSGIASVASFFVSRVDTLIDKMLDDKIKADPSTAASLESLKGKAAIANAKLAYDLFANRYYKDEFADLKAAGAQVQRPLWASTSTKNPNYPDVIYIDNLIGPDTVNTMPPATIKAFKDHGLARVTLTEGLPEANDLLDKLAEAGVDMNWVTQKLEDDGVAAFFKSFESLLNVIETRRQAELAGARTHVSLGAELAADVQTHLAVLDAQKVPARLWQKDSTLWKKDDPAHQAEIKIRMGWLTLADDMRQHVPDLMTFAKEAKKAGFTHALLCGMGGSSLCPEVLRETFGVARGGLDLGVLDSTHPDAVRAALARSSPAKTLYLVSSKSGGTTEVTSFFKFFWEQVKAVKGDRAGENFIAITDPDTSLGKLAQEHNFRRVFINPPDIGGRYSALSLFGLVPAALLGMDVGKLLARAKEMALASSDIIPSARNAGLWLGAVMGTLAKAGHDKITFIVSDPISTFGYWTEQLIAESTGKEGRGIVPVEGEPVGDPKAYGNDRLFIYLRLNSKYDRAVAKLEEAGHPVIRFDLRDIYDLGGEFLRWEIATAVSSLSLDSDPFDQPNVQESKDNTKRLLDDAASGVAWPPADPTIPAGRRDFATQLKLHLKQTKPGDYVALTAYVARTAKTEKTLRAIRAAIRDKYKVATTVGYGPRFLHSTGQLHKGGADNFLGIQFTANVAKDEAVPGEAFSFGTLIAAQALGDFQSLRSRNRRALRVQLSVKPEADLAAVAALLAPKKAKKNLTAKTRRARRK
ncbi:MAG: bifunctional transaldolase/phosoglucose isomerase [Chloroflexi bacterium]|nr:bifunctional transaldolase/phosoglucose isomerase [Chloroflexota bacterium]